MKRYGAAIQEYGPFRRLGFIEESEGKVVMYAEAAAIERQRDRAVELLRDYYNEIGVPDYLEHLDNKIQALLAEIDGPKYQPTEDTGEAD